MYFKSIAAITDSSLEELGNGRGHLLVFIADKSAAEAEGLISLFNRHNLLFFGGIFPTIIQDTHNFEEGILVIQIPAVERIIRFSLDRESSFKNIENFEEVQTALLLVDGWMGETSAFLRKIYGIFGNQMNIVGGGAGSMTLQQRPCVFTNEGIFQDGAVMALFKSKSKIGVKHGWELFAGPLIATSTDKNIIKELNWRPALEVYKEVIEENSENRFTDDNFLEIARIFPFGIHKEGTEFIVRDPFFWNENNEITCISEIPENSTLQILTGDPDTLIRAAKDVAEFTKVEQNSLHYLVIFDCISRVMYLEDRFEDELKAINDVYKNETCKIRGVATLGEIASSGMGFVEYYNKTIVASSLYT